MKNVFIVDKITARLQLKIDRFTERWSLSGEESFTNGAPASLNEGAESHDFFQPISEGQAQTFLFIQKSRNAVCASTGSHTNPNCNPNPSCTVSHT